MDHDIASLAPAGDEAGGLEAVHERFAAGAGLALERNVQRLAGLARVDALQQRRVAGDGRIGQRCQNRRVTSQVGDSYAW